MKIGIDVTSIEINPDGIGQYTQNLLNALFDIDKSNEYFLYSTKPYVTEKNNIVIKKNKKLPLKGIIWMMKVSKDAKKRKLDYLISPSNHFFSIAFPRTIQIIHDLTPVFYPKLFSWKGALLYKLGIKYIVPKSIKIAATTDTVKKELIEYAKIPAEKITVVYPSINDLIFDNPVEYVDFGLGEDYLLTISTISPKKNLTNVFYGFKKYLNQSDDYKTKLVIAGRKGWKYKDIFATINKLELKERIIFMDYVQNTYIGSLIKHSKGFFYLSIHEGFGMPILEALYFNKPVLASNIPVFKECFKDTIFYADPIDINSIADGFKTLIDNKSDLPKFDKETFNWLKSANSFLKMFK